MTTAEALHRIRTHFAGVAVLLGLLTVVAEPGRAPLLVGVVLAAALLALSAIHVLPAPVLVHLRVGRHRARAPGVILTSTHPDAAGHSRPRAPGVSVVAPA